MRQSLVTFLCFLLTAAVIVAAEGVFLLLSFEKIHFKLAQNTKDALALAERDAAHSPFKMIAQKVDLGWH